MAGKRYLVLFAGFVLVVIDVWLAGDHLDSPHVPNFFPGVKVAVGLLPWDKLVDARLVNAGKMTAAEFDKRYGEGAWAKVMVEDESDPKGSAGME